MTSLPFTIRQLEVFATLSDTKSFRDCADLLGISQASVSGQIKTLEDQLGTKLLARRPGKRPSLTAEGHAFLKDLREFNEAGAKLARHRRQAHEREEVAVFRVLVGSAMMERFIKPKLSRFLAENPTLECRFETRSPTAPDEVMQDIHSGRYDYALFHLRERWPISPGMRVVAHAPGGIYGHRKFAKGPLPLKLDQLNELPFIFAAMDSKGERQMFAALSRQGIKPKHIITHTQYFDVVAALIEQGIGVAPILAAVFDPEKMDDIVMLYPMDNWQLVSFNKHSQTDPRARVLEDFMVSSVICNPLYPKIDDEHAEETTEIVV
jgi:DNA-binding transcriptional LysR family regulator